MKKLLILILTLLMVFSLASCKGRCEKKGHKDKNTDGICDRCDAHIDGEHNVHTDSDANGYCDGCNALYISYGDNNVVGKILRKSLEKQFEEAKSMKITLEYESEIKNNSWDSYYDDDDSEIIYLETQTKTESATIEMLISKTDTGFNARVELNMIKTRKDAYSDDDYEYIDEDETAKVVYLIDGYVYEQIADDTYIQSEAVRKEIFDILSGLSQAELVSKEKSRELLDALGAEIASVLDINNNAGSVSIDLEPAATELFKYINDLDFEKDTVGMLINDALTLVSENLTVDDIIDELERVGALTVGEALAEIDKWLTDEHGTTVQGIYDTLIANPGFIEAFDMFFLEVNRLDPEAPETQEILTKFNELVKSFKLADYIVEAELADMTVYQLVNEMSKEDLGEYDELIATLRAVTDMTLGEFDAELANDRLYMIKYIADSMKITDLNAKIDVRFKNMLELVGIDASFNLGIYRENASSIEGKTDNFTSKLSIKLTVSDISTDPVKIALDENDLTVSENLISNTFHAEDGFLYTFYRVSEDGKVYVGINGDYADPRRNEAVVFQSENIPLDELLKDEITLTDFEFTFNGKKLAVADGSVMRIKLDVEKDSFTFIELPEYELENDAYAALVEYAADPMKLGYTFHGIESITENKGYYTILFFEGYPLSFIEGTLTNGEDNRTVVFTITSINVDSDHKLLGTDGVVWYGGNGDPEELNAYFDGDPTFTIVLDVNYENLSIPTYPMVEDEYKYEWPEG